MEAVLKSAAFFIAPLLTARKQLAYIPIKISAAEYPVYPKADDRLR